MTKFHIAKSPHQFGMRWSVLEQNGQITLDEICRCPSMANASLICDALNHAAGDRVLWPMMLEKAATSFTKMEDKRASAKKRRNALQPSQGRAAESVPGT